MADDCFTHPIPYVMSQDKTASAMPALEVSNSSRQTSHQEASTSGSGPEYWQDLLGAPEPDMFGSRARSASDAGVLRRKGHLKEQDQMIEFMLRMHETHTSLEVMQKMEKWILEHQKVGGPSLIKRTQAYWKF